MKKGNSAQATFLIVAMALLATAVPANAWVTAYLAAWEVSQNGVQPAQIDMRSITHLVWFSLTPTAAGKLIEASGIRVTANAPMVAEAVHNARKKVLICIGGANTSPLFRAAFRAGKTGALVKNIVDWVDVNQYDGVDIDDEPLAPGDSPAYIDFIRSLRKALPTNKQLTAAAEPFGEDRPVFGILQDSFDQINIMTYDMIFGNPMRTGAGQVTWFNAPLLAGKNYEQDGATPMPSVAGALSEFEHLPIPASKLAIGTAFYGYDFPNTTSYEQAYRGPWPLPDADCLSYAQIVSDPRYYSQAWYQYDAATQSAYIGRRDTGNFITFDDPTAVIAKTRYARQYGLGGIVCFEIGQQYMNGRNPLLAAIDLALIAGP